MKRKLLHWLPIISIIALLVALVPAGALAQSPQAGPPPTVNGLFYGDGDYAIYQWYGDSPAIPPSTRTRGSLYKYYDPSTGWLYFAMVVDRSANDNVFAWRIGGPDSDRDYLDSSGWGSNGHTFEQLYSSDNMEFYMSCGGNSWDWYHGYLYDENLDHNPAQADWLSGPEDNSIGGGTWPASLVTASSLQWNMNNMGWDVTLGGARTTWGEWKSPASGAGGDQVSHINVITGGSGYITPTVTIDPPGVGTTATAVAMLQGGAIGAIYVTDGGSGYAGPPNVTIGDEATPGGTGATATAVLGPTDAAGDRSVLDEEGYPPVSQQPADNINYNSIYGWEWPMVYEFAFDFQTECGGADFDQLMVVSAHNSPPKDTSDTVPLSVDLASFDAEVLPGGGQTRSIALSWETTDESSNAGFFLWRGTEADGVGRVQINAEIIPSEAPAAGGGAVYEYTDENLAKKTTYYYWLQDVDMSGTAGWSDPIAVTTTGKGRGQGPKK
jgi:hypothetical protein